MKPEYIDNSETARNEVLTAVLDILKGAKVKLEKESSFIFVLEGTMPNAIRALHKAGFHRTSSMESPGKYLALRRLNILVEVQMPPVHFGADVLVNRLKKSQKLILSPMRLSKEGVVAKTREDARIDISYQSVLSMYEENEKLNAWRNHMQFVLPENEQVSAMITLLDRCIDLHATGSAVDYDRFVVRWNGRQGILTFIPSSGEYDIEINVGGFSWTSSGSEFNYSETAEDLFHSVKHHLETTGDKSHYQSVTSFHERMVSHMRNEAALHHGSVKHLV